MNMKTYRGYNTETEETFFENSKAHLWAKILIFIQFKSIIAHSSYIELGEVLTQWDITEV